MWRFQRKLKDVWSEHKPNGPFTSKVLIVIDLLVIPSLNRTAVTVRNITLKSSGERLKRATGLFKAETLSVLCCANSCGVEPGEEPLNLNIMEIS